jgi:hypothetical protein
MCEDVRCFWGYESEAHLGKDWVSGRQVESRCVKARDISKITILKYIRFRC